jgi:hypothetical protein
MVDGRWWKITQMKLLVSITYLRKKEGYLNAPFCMMYRCIEFQQIELSQTEQALLLICWGGSAKPVQAEKICTVKNISSR